MLFRRCAYYSSLVLISLSCLSSMEGSNALDRYKNRGEEWQAQPPCLELTQKETEKLTPKESKGKTFDGEQAYRQLADHVYQNAGKASMGSDPRYTAIVESTECLFTNQNQSQEVETIEKCLFEKTLIPLTLNYTLSVKLLQKPKTFQTVRICKGHKEEQKSRTPSHSAHKKKEEFKADASIASFHVTTESKGLGHRDLVVSHYKHVNNASCCTNSELTQVAVDSGRWEETDTWHADQAGLPNHLECTPSHTITGQPETRLIEDREVFRPFWKKSVDMKCTKTEQKNCDFLHQQTCIQTDRSCIHSVDGECQIWEVTFKCRKQLPALSKGETELYGLKPQLWEKKREENRSFPDISTKLAIFDEMKKELQNSQTADVRQVSLFKGTKQKCSKSVLQDVLYDCCFDMDGLATKAKLSKCTADEIALAASTKKGLTHFVGVKKEEFLGMWESRKENVYCVFSSKLSRVFQEEARKQLGIEWGSADHPDCRGLTQEEIKKLDFTKLNLVEAFELPSEKDQGDRIKQVEERLKQRVENM